MSESMYVMSTLTRVDPGPRTASTSSLTGTLTLSMKGSTLLLATRVLSTVTTRLLGSSGVTLLVVTTVPRMAGNTSRSTSEISLPARQEARKERDGLTDMWVKGAIRVAQR